MKKAKLKRSHTDDEIDALIRETERLRDASVEAKDEYEASHAYLKDVLEDNGFSDFKCDADLSAKVQPSFTLERRPNAPQRALDLVFERVPYSYVRITRLSVPEPPITKKRS